MENLRLECTKAEDQMKNASEGRRAALQRLAPVYVSWIPREHDLDTFMGWFDSDSVSRLKADHSNILDWLDLTVRSLPLLYDQATPSTDDFMFGNEHTRELACLALFIINEWKRKNRFKTKEAERFVSQVIRPTVLWISTYGLSLQAKHTYTLESLLLCSRFLLLLQAIE